jgi:hypothetical protein
MLHLSDESARSQYLAMDLDEHHKPGRRSTKVAMWLVLSAGERGKPTDNAFIKKLMAASEPSVSMLSGS